MPQVYISFVGYFEGEKIDFTYDQLWDRIERDQLDSFGAPDDYRYAELLSYRSLVTDIVRGLPIIDSQSKDSLIVTAYALTDGRRIIVADCPDGEWCEAAYVTAQFGGTQNPPGVDVRVHLF